MNRRRNLNISTCTVSSQMLGISAAALCCKCVAASQSTFSNVSHPPLNFTSVKPIRAAFGVSSNIIPADFRYKRSPFIQLNQPVLDFHTAWWLHGIFLFHCCAMLLYAQQCLFHVAETDIRSDILFLMSQTGNVEGERSERKKRR